MDPKCKTKKLNIALNFHNQKSLRRYDDSVRRNLIFCSGGRKFGQYEYFYFPRYGPNFCQFFSP